VLADETPPASLRSATSPKVGEVGRARRAIHPSYFRRGRPDGYRGGGGRHSPLVLKRGGPQGRGVRHSGAAQRNPESAV